MAKNVSVRFAANGGLQSVGPFRTGVAYKVPDDVAPFLILRGAESANSADTHELLDSRHLEAFDAIRADVAAAAPATKTTTAPADAAVQSGEVK